MKPKILFVDDDPLILSALQRMLRSVREEWDMEFLPSAEEGLRRMESVAFDAVVSDMRMPQMNGQEFLDRVMAIHPQTARIILSGQSDQELIVKSLGVTHQFLSKPCDPETLKEVLRRTLTVGSLLPDEQIKQLVARISSLPTAPDLYIKINAVLQSPEASISDVATLVSRDIGMTAKILKVINSAYFGLPQAISSVDHAVEFLGFHTIKSLILTVGTFSRFPETGILPVEHLWSHSLSTAVAAEKIVRLERGNQAMREEAFTAGILHDTGKLILASNFPKLYAQAAGSAKKSARQLVEVEPQFFGATHANIGGYLLGLWGLQEAVVHAVSHHHSPGMSASGRSFGVLTAVHAANALLHERETPPQPGSLDKDYLDSIGMVDRIPAWRNAVASSLPESQSQQTPNRP